MRTRARPSTSTFTVPSGSFSSCSTLASTPTLKIPSIVGIVHRRINLARQQDLLVVLHHFFKRAHGFFTPDKKRHDHVRENHDVAQRQDREGLADLLGHMTSLS